MSLDFLFNPKSIALIGAAHSEDKLGGVILKNLLKFKGRVYPVNPNYTELMGLKAYPSANEIPEPVDTAVIIRPASEVPQILRGLKGKAVCAVIISAGFAETGNAGLQDEIKKIAEDEGLRILGPNCMGVYNPLRKLDTLFLPYERLKRPKKGNIAVVSQSGAIITYLFDAIRVSNAGVSKVVGYGNAADIDESDIFGHLAGDKHTDVVISYIESLGNGREFISAAKELSEKKSLLILKSGKSSEGRSAAFSHTGRLAGRYEVFSSILRQFGIKEVSDLEELIDAAKALSFQKQLKKIPSPPFAGGFNNRVLIITNGGGSGVLAADECMKQGLDVTKTPEEGIKKLAGVLPPFYGLNNPVDLTAQVRIDDYAVVLNELRDDYAGFLIVALTGVAGITPALAQIIEGFKSKTGKPVVMHTGNNPESKKLISLAENAGIPVYPSPERAVRGLKALLGLPPGSREQGFRALETT